MTCGFVIFGITKYLLGHHWPHCWNDALVCACPSDDTLNCLWFLAVTVALMNFSNGNLRNHHGSSGLFFRHRVLSNYSKWPDAFIFEFKQSLLPNLAIYFVLLLLYPIHLSVFNYCILLSLGKENKESGYFLFCGMKRWVMEAIIGLWM